MVGYGIFVYFGERGVSAVQAHPIWGCSRCTRSPMSGVNERMYHKLFGREIIFQEFQPMWSWYLIVTDRQTDGRTDDLLSHHRALR